MDDSFLKVSAFNQQITEGDDFVDADTFYESMLADGDDAGILLDSVVSDGPGSIHVNLDLDLDLFNSFIDDYGISENIVFTSAFAYTLSRFVGSDKVLFNVVENGRDRFNNLNSIGMFVNTLPLLADCKNQDVSSFIEDMSSLIYDVMRYNYYPFRLLANKYDINSDILFQFIPKWIKDDDIEMDYDLLADSEGIDLISTMNDFISDFTFEVIQNIDGYILRVIYSDKYSSDLVGHFVESYNLILQEMLCVDRLSDMNYISAEDIKLLDGYNETDHELLYGDVLDAFNDNLIKYPNNNFVSFKDVSYTYGEGAFIANKIAEQLIDLGVGAQDCVSFLVERSELYMFCALGILSMGGVYVPLDDKLPDERIKFMLNDTGSKVVVVSDETYDYVDSLMDDSVVLLNISDIVNDEVGKLNELSVVYGDLACILYTSGTTGIPKGVKVTRKSVINVAEYYADEYGLDNGDVYGLFSNIGFDAALLAMMVVFYSGAGLSVVPDDIRLNVNLLNEYFINQNVSHTLITSQVGRLFMESISNTSLDVLLVGGEKLGEFDSPEDYLLVDAFGPTEAGVFISSIKNSEKIDSSSIGSLNYNTKVYILDKENRRVPIGAVGELCLSGNQIADGYLNRDEETAQAFTDNPFDDGKYATLYHTGDVVRFLPDGSLGIVGRQDGQVKIRGNRVELPEVEDKIRELDYVDDVTVQTVKNKNNNELVAYVVVSEDMTVDILRSNIQRYIRDSKPDYMVPSFVVQLDDIPLTVNGKVDKRALPEVDVKELREEYVAPRNEIERQMVHAFEEVFNQEDIGIYDDFIRLGGDSLTAIRLLSYFDDYNLSAGDILSLRTPCEIANNIKEVSLDLDVYSLESGCPLTEPQLNVYLDIVANDKMDSYLIHLFMDISKDYGVDKIVDALDEMFRVHPILGMCVSDDYDVPYLVRGSKPEILVESGADEDLIMEFLTKPFDMHDCLSRFLIVENDDNYSLYGVFHHIIFDALSDGVFKQNLQAILDGKSVVMDDSFLKVSAFNQQIKEDDDFVEADNFYESMLADAEDTGILLDSVVSDGPGSIDVNLNLDMDLFNSFIDDYGISENIVFTSAFAYTLSRFTGDDKVLFNMIENGRDRFNNLNSIGMFVNTLPLLADCKNQDVSSFIGDMSSLIYDVMRYNYYPFRLLANKYDITSDILFQFIPKWIKDDDIEINENSSSDYENTLIDDVDELVSDLIVYVIQNEDNYVLNAIYSDKYSSDLVGHFVESYNLILQEMLCADRLSDMNYISAEDIKLLDNYNETEHELVHDDVLDAFNDNLAKYHDNILVSFNDVSYSYGEGAFIADKLAKKLVDLGADAQDCISFMVERSELYMFCALGILSMGGVYVPLDDKLPEERIRFMLDDTQSKVVVVSDMTYDYVDNLVDDDVVLLNISDIVNGDVAKLDELPVVYGELACILYTSGTTGVPKGVKITRKSILNVSEYYVGEYGLDSNDVYGLFSNIGFDVSNFIIGAVLVSGACLCVVPEDILLNMNKMNEYFIEQGVTHAFITTQVGKLYMQNAESVPLDVLLVAGEKLGEVDSPEDYLLVDAYGPTEAFAFISSIKNSDKLDSSSIGSLNYNMKSYVLDGESRRVPIGAVGELCLAGYQIADGYLNRDEETANAFIINPFDAGEYDALYRTGDLVRMLPDGSLAIVGRLDSQVKIRGNRVELSEVESVIRDIDYVEDVTVQTIKNGDNYELVAYVVISEDMDDSNLTNDVQSYVGNYKPDYMLPSFVIKLDSIPLNVNGKVDKQALPEVDLDVLRVEYVAPTNETEKLIIQAFENAFNQKGIGLYDDFTSLGGDSITAIRVISLLERNGISCTARDILNYKTPYLIAQNVETVTKESYDSTDGEVSLLPIQSYFFDQVNSDEFSQEFILKSKVSLDLDILQEAFDELSNVHDILRATYKYGVNNNIIQEIMPLDTCVCEIKEYFADDLNNAIGKVIKESKESLDVFNDLIKISLVHYDDDCYVVFVIHHLIIDGVSWGILIDDLTYTLNQIKENKKIELLRSYPYKNWVEDVKSLVEDISSEEKQHWIEINELLDNLDIEGESKGFSFSVVSKFDPNNILMLSEEEYLALCIARAYKKTYGMDVIFNRESHGRDENIADVSHTIGWFTSQFPVLVKVSNGNDNISLMNDVYNIKNALKDVNHLGLNYGSLIYTSKELEYKHCPVTFNFLSTEFSFENELFESINLQVSSGGELDIFDLGGVSAGISLNVSHVDDLYVFQGFYAEGTYLGDKFREFIENIKFEL